jgi:hypothetical protein
MPESQSEFDIRMLKFKVQNLEHQVQSALSDMRDQLALFGDRVAALEQRTSTTRRSATIPKPEKKAPSNSNAKGVPEFEGI